jgi:hypothetical protein
MQNNYAFDNGFNVFLPFIDDRYVAFDMDIPNYTIR